MEGTENINTSNFNLANAIEFMTKERDDKLYLLTDRIKLHCGTEEELVKQLIDIITANNRLKTLKNGLDMLQQISEYKIMKENQNNKLT